MQKYICPVCKILYSGRDNVKEISHSTETGLMTKVSVCNKCYNTSKIYSSIVAFGFACVESEFSGAAYYIKSAIDAIDDYILERLERDYTIRADDSMINGMSINGCAINQGSESRVYNEDTSETDTQLFFYGAIQYGGKKYLFKTPYDVFKLGNMASWWDIDKIESHAIYV